MLHLLFPEDFGFLVVSAAAHEESVSWNWTPSPWREWCRENSSTVPASADASRTSKSTSGGCSGLKLDAYGALSELFASWLRTWFDFDFLTKFHEFLLDLFPPSGKEFRDLFPPDGVGELISASVLISCTYAPKFPRVRGFGGQELIWSRTILHLRFSPNRCDPPASKPIGW